MRHRQPEGLLHVADDAGIPLARLAGLEGLTRAVMVGTVPLAALDALGSKTAVSVAFFIGSSLTVFVTLNIGRVERVVGRRWVLTGGIVSVACAALLFAYGPSWAIPAAIGLRSVEASVFSVCLSLYIMDFISKSSLTHAESRRSVYLAGSWLIGPVVGTWLWSNVGRDVPFLVSIVLAILLVSYHWRLRLAANPILRGAVTPAPGPLQSIPRFFSQRSLRISYAITCIRAVFWATLFIYGPIYVVEAGLPEWSAGAFLSVSSVVLFLGPVIRDAAARFGVRQVIICGFALMTVSLSGLAVIGEARPVGIAFWLLGALGGGMIDVLGNIPFMRLVKPRERTAMVTVYSTWREVSFLVAPGLAAVVLVLANFAVLYVVLAMLMVGGIASATYLPRRL